MKDKHSSGLLKFQLPLAETLKTKNLLEATLKIGLTQPTQ